MKPKDVKIYLKVWLRLTALQFQQQVANEKGAAILLIFGKLFRFAVAFVFLWAIVGQAKLIAGYNLAEAVFVLAIFNWSSSATQLLLRGVYQFKDKVENGDFDFYLLSPISELFSSLFSYTDPLDAMLMIPYTLVVYFSWVATGFPITGPSLLWLFIALLATAVFVLAVHIVVLAIGVKYLEVDNTIMLYRDMERMAGFPIDIYGKYLNIALTYVLPFAVIATVPAKLVFGWLHPAILLFFLALSLAELYGAHRLWHLALKSYSSASS